MNKIKSLGKNLGKNSRQKIQTADGKSLHFRLAIQPYFTRAQAQTEIYLKNHFPSGKYQTLSNQYQRLIPPDGNGVNKNLQNSRRKIRFGPYCLWHQLYFPDGNTSPITIVIENHKGSQLR